MRPWFCCSRHSEKPSNACKAFARWEKWFGKFRQRIKRNLRALGVAFEAHANWSIYVEEEVVRCQAATS